MLFAPSDKPFNYRTPPRLSLGLAALLLVLFAWFFPQEQTQLKHLNERYQQDLLAIEWPLYPTHLLQSKQIKTLDKLNQAYANKDYMLITQQIGFDRRFVAHVASMGENYLDPEQLAKWQQARKDFDTERDKLSSQVLGLDPQRFRPITYMSYSFIDSQSMVVLSSVLLLLFVGMATEWAMGSGAVLSAWLLGAMATGVVYHLGHLHGVLPLLGSTGAASGLLGLAFMSFRKANSLTILGTQKQLSGWLCVALFLLVLGIELSMSLPLNINLLMAYFVSFVVGMLVYTAHQHWFKPVQAPPIIEEDIENSAALLNQTYQQELHQALQQLSQLEFSLAKQSLQELAELYPNNTQIHEHLYHLYKFKPTELAFEELACLLLSLSNQAANNHLSLRIYNDYKKRSRSFIALDTDTCLQLAMRFARINAFKDAEEIFKRALDNKKPSLLFKKAALTLQQCFAAQHQEQRALFYEKIASQYEH